MLLFMYTIFGKNTYCRDFVLYYLANYDIIYEKWYGNIEMICSRKTDFWAVRNPEMVIRKKLKMDIVYSKT